MAYKAILEEKVLSKMLISAEKPFCMVIKQIFYVVDTKIT